MNPLQLAQIMGHSSLAMIQSDYSHLTPQDAYSALERIMRSPDEQPPRNATYRWRVRTARRYTPAMNIPLDIVGEAEIADRLGVKRPTVHAWAKRNHLPAPEWTVSGQPAWRWSTIAAWAEDRFGLRGSILAYLAGTQGAGTSTIANVLAMKGRRDVSISQVARDLNAMFQQGLVGRAMAPRDWVITSAGRQALETGELLGLDPNADAASTFWTHPLVEGGPFPAGVRVRIRRVTPQREAEVKSPNGEPAVQVEAILVHSYYTPTGFETWDDWFEATEPA